MSDFIFLAKRYLVKKFHTKTKCLEKLLVVTEVRYRCVLLCRCNRLKIGIKVKIRNNAMVLFVSF